MLGIEVGLADDTDPLGGLIEAEVVAQLGVFADALFELVDDALLLVHAAEEPEHVEKIHRVVIKVENGVFGGVQDAGPVAADGHDVPVIHRLRHMFADGHFVL